MGSPVPSTAVTFPYLGPRGYVIPDTAQVQAGAQSDLNAAFGGKLNFTTQSGSITNPTPQAQVVATETALLNNSFALFALFCNLVDPAYSSGRMQDAIGRLYFIDRFPSAPTIQPSLCVGLDQVIIPVGALAQDQSGNLWIAQQQGTIVDGSVLINFACTTNGPVAAPESLKIYQAVFGWNSIMPEGAAVIGQNEETPAQFEGRRALSTGLNSMGPLNAVYAACGEVPGVLDVFTAQNNTTAPVVIGGVTLAGHSMYVCVLGGDSAAVALAIYSRKMPGCVMNGNTTVVVTDPNPAYLPPAPTTPITFETPTIVDLAVVVTITDSNQVPSNAVTLVQNAIISAFAGGDGGPRAKIGSVVYASRYYGPVTAISNTNGATGQVIPGWSAPIVSIQLGVDGTQGSVTGSISGTTLTVSAVSSGSLGVGDLVEGSGITTGPFIISSLLSGTGSAGTYALSASGVYSSRALSITALGNDVAMNINQAPGVAAPNIYLALQPVP